MMDEARRQYERERKRRYRAELRKQRLENAPPVQVAPSYSQSSEPMLSSVREYERERKRRYRAGLTDELEQLRAKAAFFRDELERYLHHKTDSLVLPDVSAIKAIENKALRMQLEQQRRLLQVLQSWVQPSIQPALGQGNPWLHSTLLADADARQVGYKWLTDRVFHSAVAAHASILSVDDTIGASFITGEDEFDILGVENTTQHTFFANYEAVAKVVWDEATNITSRPNGTQITFLAGDGSFRYQRIVPRPNINIQMLVRRYDLATRIVLCYVYVRDDECFPLEVDHGRPYGIGWTAIEKIADDVTLCRTRTSQCGNLSFDQMAARFGVTPHPSREVMLARMQNNSLKGLAHQADAFARTVNDAVAQMNALELLDDTVELPNL
ncbi:Aste57867_20509 [Aphanomyces stellatus]|uniref:Aste57867_20509 protein n=1 Tax=Aphanomyces stellatus TaxID=120398 RepID=A0A485LF50_9STRA|nr:hypothetical protein As57867_020443 [Aphanomyces stellatus]VFT97194.1 Aste57867_20509 [Aphanomyces stellatus]